MRYVSLHHLHHSTFSHGDGHKLPAVHVARAVELGYTAQALTEHGGTSSHFQFEQAAVKAGLKPIFGLEAYCGPVGENRSQSKYHLTILAENQDGYRNLNRLVTQSWRDHHYHPTVSGENLKHNSPGLSSFQDVLEASLRVHSSAVREYPIPLREAVMDGMTRDASSDVLPLYLGPITTSKSSPSTSWRKPAGSIQLMNDSAVRPEFHSSPHVMYITQDPQIQRCRQSSTQYIARISLLTTQCERGTTTFP